MKAPKVSIIMNCRNCSELLAQAIDSIYAQSFGDWEIVFWDNLSSDSSPEIVKKYDGRIKYFLADEPQDLGAARNEAVKRATGEFITFLDTDDLWEPSHLQELLDCFTTEDTIAAYGPFTIRNETTGSVTEPFNPDSEFSDGIITSALCKKNFIWLQTFMVRTKVVQELDEIFDTNLLTAEDFDFVLRISMKGNFRYKTTPTFIYRMHEDNLTMSRRHYFAHDFAYLLEKYKSTLPSAQLKNLARQYLTTVRLDLSSAGFRFFPFISLGLNPRQIAMSLVFSIFGTDDIWALKERLRNLFK